jgi:hypothetical protein
LEISVEEIKPGMVLRLGLSQGGRVILNQGAILSPAIIETLKRRGVRKVDVLNEESGVAPGAGVLDTKTLDLRDNPDYVRERDEVEKLFSSVRADDSQMMILKYCVLRQLKEAYLDDR